MQKQRKRKWQYTVSDIVDAIGFDHSINVVRDHITKGYLDPGELRSVSEYVAGFRSMHKLKHDEDAWGGSHGKRGRHD